MSQLSREQLYLMLSTIAISPVNFHGLPNYDGCWFYVGTPQKKDFFLCAETPGAARAWVSTLHATKLVLKVHKGAVNSLSGNGYTKLGTVATVVAAANSTTLEASKEIEAAMQIAMRNALEAMMNTPTDAPINDLTIMMLREYEEKVVVLSKEKDQLIKERDSARQEAHLWRSVLAKAREHAVILEGAAVRAEEKVRIAEADAEARIKEAAQKAAVALKEKQ